MPSSWAQHKTVVEQRSRLQVGEVFQAGETVELEGNAPVVLRKVERIWFVESGAVDLFLVDVVEGQASGRRFHVVRVPEGEVFLETPVVSFRKENRSIGLLAVGVAGTRARVLSQERLRTLARPLGASDAVHGLLDLWVRRFADGLPLANRPVEAEPMETGNRYELEEPKTLATNQKTVWVHLVSGIMDYCDYVPFKPPEAVRLIPLTRSTWIRTTAGSVIRVLDTGTFFRTDREWRSFEYFHRVSLAALDRARVRDLATQRYLVQERADRDHELVGDAIWTLAQRSSGTAPASQDLRTDPLEASFSRLTDHMGLPFRPAPPGTTPSLEGLCRSNHVRSREVILRDGWWRRSGEPMMGVLAEEQTPVALVPRISGGYSVSVAGRRHLVRITDEIAEAIRPTAHSLYRPFPAKSLAPWDLLRWSLHGVGSDLLLIALSGAFLGLLGLTIPLAFGQIIDSIIPDAEAGLLVQMGLGLVTVSFATFVTQTARSLATVRAETRMASGVQGAVWDRLLSLPVPFFRDFSAGDLAMRANGIDRIRRALSGSTLEGALTSLFSLMSFALLVVYDPMLALVALILSLGGVALTLGLGLASLSATRKHEAVESRLSAQVLEMLTGITKLRICGAEQRAFHRWVDRFAEKRRLAWRVETLRNRFDTIESFYPVFATMVVFYIVAQPTSTMTTGAFLAFNAAFGTFMTSLWSLVGVGLQQLEILPLWERARPILSAVPEVDEVKSHPGSLTGEIQVSRVAFRYDMTSAPVLDGIDFEVRRGEFLAVVGSSGAGKSTLLRVLLGFETPTSGGVFYDGRDLANLDVVEVRRQLGVVLQNGELMAGDIFTNIVGSRKLTLDDAWQAARMAGLAKDIEAMPMQMHTVVAQGGRNLSGGQQQRILIARALVTRPRIIFFDEATSALDEKTQQVVSESLDQMDATRIVIAHRLSTIRRADRIVVLDRGRIVQIGQFDDLMEQDGLFRELAQRQVA